MLEQFKTLLDEYNQATHLQIALADISFSFPATCKYPSLSVTVDEFGLINPLEGRTVATLPEVHLALYQGAQITYHDVVVLEEYQDSESEIFKESQFAFREHLYNLYSLRNEAKRNNEELLQQLYKTYSNSLYGKLAQGINKRTMFNTRDGASKRLPKSNITNAYYASLTTGLIRAALSSVIVAIEELIQEGHDYIIISATTDGCLYGIDNSKLSIEDTINKDDKTYNYNNIHEALSNGYKKFISFETVDPVLAKRLLKFPSLRLLKISHEAWNDAEYIEVKHVANRVLNFKTRGQVGHYDSEAGSTCTILAKAGHKISGTKNEQAQWILDHYRDEKIQKYRFTTLSSVRDIIDENIVIDDLVSLPQERVISLDYDYKRHPVSDSDTAPHKDINQFTKFRQSASYLKNLGERASINAVDYKYKRAEQGIRKTGSNKKFVARHILRGLLQGVKPFKNPDMSYARLAILLQEYGVNISQIKHAKSTKFTPNMVEDTSGNRVIIRQILRLLNYKTRTNYKNFLKLLLHQKITNADQISYLD